jgi:hypothetical protein
VYIVSSKRANVFPQRGFKVCGASDVAETSYLKGCTLKVNLYSELRCGDCIEEERLIFVVFGHFWHV